MNNPLIAEEAARLKTCLNEQDRFQKIGDRIAELAALGWGRKDLLAVLEMIRPPNDEEVENDVLAVMDCVVGFCSPHARIKTRDDTP